MQDELFCTLNNVCKVFLIQGNMLDYIIMTDGNINKTYQVNFDTGKSYLLQKVNTFVFKHPDHVMHNVDLVTTHLIDKCKDESRVHFHHLENRKNYYENGDGSFWRLRNFIDAVTYNTCDDLAILEGAGRAFGKFQTDLSDFDATQLYETIPDFHNTKKRFVRFMGDVAKDEFGRVSQAKDEIAFLESVRDTASELSEMIEIGAVPLRVTHNDTKINNVLFDKDSGVPLVVIDLDTVMPGLAMHDFGDAVRFAASTACEDEKDLTKVSIDLKKYKAFAKGFIGETAGNLTPTEIDSMALGSFTITVELGMRFLGDYITGDKYFKTLYEGHNLDRARCQLHLAKDMLSKKEEMMRIVREFSAE